MFTLFILALLVFCNTNCMEKPFTDVLRAATTMLFEFCDLSREERVNKLWDLPESKRNAYINVSSILSEHTNLIEPLIKITQAYFDKKNKDLLSYITAMTCKEGLWLKSKMIQFNDRRTFLGAQDGKLLMHNYLPEGGPTFIERFDLRTGTLIDKTNVDERGMLVAKKGFDFTSTEILEGKEDFRNIDACHIGNSTVLELKEDFFSLYDSASLQSNLMISRPKGELYHFDMLDNYISIVCQKNNFEPLNIFTWDIKTGECIFQISTLGTSIESTIGIQKIVLFKDKAIIQKNHEFFLYTQNSHGACIIDMPGILVGAVSDDSFLYEAHIEQSKGIVKDVELHLYSIHDNNTVTVTQSYRMLADRGNYPDVYCVYNKGFIVKKDGSLGLCSAYGINGVCRQKNVPAFEYWLFTNGQETKELEGELKSFPRTHINSIFAYTPESLEDIIVYPRSSFNTYPLEKIKSISY